jgi:hypothetical protein
MMDVNVDEHFIIFCTFPLPLGGVLRCYPKWLTILVS